MENALKKKEEDMAFTRADTCRGSLAAWRGRRAAHRWQRMGAATDNNKTKHNHTCILVFLAAFKGGEGAGDGASQFTRQQTQPSISALKAAQNVDDYEFDLISHSRLNKYQKSKVKTKSPNFL